MAADKKIQKLRPGIREVAVSTELPALLQRVRGNKSKRTAKELVEDGPLRVTLVALDTQGKLQDLPASAFSLMCLLGRVQVSGGGPTLDISAGDMILAEEGSKLEIEARQASALLLTAFSREAKGDE